MRPPNSLTYELGTERGAPWGRDLFTFVTSAAGHMMRTLQRPRKNRPSKRQVNHRRFLHNMIHRKFAEIEAANRQLSSALFSKEGEGSQVLPTHFESTDQSGDTPSEESSIEMPPPALPSVPMALGLSPILPDDTTPPNEQEDPNGLWAFNLQLDNPREETDLSYSHTFGTDAETNHHTFKRGGLGTAGEERCIRCSSPDTPGQSIDIFPLVNFQLEPIKVDNLMKVTDITLDGNVSNWVENVKKRERIRDSPNSDPLQQYNLTTQMPDTHLSHSNPSPSSPTESQSLASCAFGIQIITDTHGSLDNMSNILENPQIDIIDSFEQIDADVSDGEGCIDSETISGTFWEPQTEDLNCDMHFGSMLFNTTCDTSTIQSCTSTDNIMRCRESSMKQNMGVKPRTVSVNDTNSPDLDYFSACFPNFFIFDQLLTNESRENGDVDHDLGMREFWGSDPARTGKTKTSTLNSKISGGTEQREVKVDSLHILGGNNQFTTNYTTSSDSYTGTGPAFPSFVCSSQEDSRYVLRKSESEDFESQVPGMGSPLKTPVLDTSLNFMAANPPLLPNACPQNKNTSSCMRGETYHTPFMGVARSFPAPIQKTCSNQILTPPLEDDWLFDSIIGEGGTKESGIGFLGGELYNS